MKKNLLLAALSVIFVFPVLATTYYVDANQLTNNGNATSWATAKRDLQEAIKLVVTGDSVLVAQGTYYPTQAPFGVNTAPRRWCFFLNVDITLIGGFPSPIGNNQATGGPTILSGDIGKYGDPSDNTYHVFITYNLTSAALIKGFVISGGRADGTGSVSFLGNFYDNSRGGGMFNQNSSPSLNEIVIADNYASTSGGGMENWYADISLKNSVICDNTGSGGIYSIYSNAFFTNITVAFNSGNLNGGIKSYYDTLTISNSVIYGNNVRSGSCNADICLNSSVLNPTSENNASDVSPGNLSNFGGFQFLNTSPFAGVPAGPDGVFTTLDDGLRPRYGSNLIDNAGNALALPDTLDVSGVPRSLYGSVDIGAYEYNCKTFSGLKHQSCNASYSPGWGQPISSSGIYYDTLLNSQGCDSLVRLEVIVNPKSLYVDASRPDNSGDGLSWATAKRDLQNALNLAATGCDTIRVAEGRYFPTEPTNGDTSSSRANTFYITKDVVLLGGFPAGGGQRDFRTFRSILDGDVGVPYDRSDNCYNVMLLVNLTSSTIINGFTITNGKGNLNGNRYLGNQMCYTDYGGGIFLRNSNPILTNLIITNNYASFGGGVCCYESSPSIYYCVVSGNDAYFNGGGIRIDRAPNNVQLVNSVIENNLSTTGGGGIAVYLSPQLSVVNTAFVKNTSSNSSGGQAIRAESVAVSLQNSVFYDHGFHKAIYLGSAATITPGSANNASDDTTGALAGTTKLIGLKGNPFLNTLSPKGGDGLWMSLDDGLRPVAGSPIIDSGDNSAVNAPNLVLTEDLSGLLRIENAFVDIGPYEHVCSSFSGDHVTACGSYTTMEGQVMTSSGVFRDTLINTRGCDSVMSVYVNIRSARVFYVDSARPDNSGNGTSWATAKKDLQEAIELATASNGCNVIKVAEGTYYPTLLLDSNSTDPRDKTFLIAHDMTISGGYPSGGGVQNPGVHNTILSGDIGIKDDSTDNCYHVVVTHGLSSISQLEGLIITKGYAYGSSSLTYSGVSIWRDEGASLYIFKSSVRLSGLVVSKHSSAGGSLVAQSSALELVNLLFTSNFGGAALWFTNSDVTLKNSTFYNNSAGVGASGKNFKIFNCAFFNNKRDVMGPIAHESQNNASDLPSGYDLSRTTNFIHLATDPFLDGNSPQGPDGRWMSSDDGLQPKADSSLVDAGAMVLLPYTDLAGGKRVFNNLPDIGAYELNCTNAVLVDNGTLWVNTPNSSYQWLDCSTGFTAIPGATSQLFTPVSNGSYAVVTGNGECLDTSACYAVNNIGLHEAVSQSMVHCYPNPTKGNVIVILPEVAQTVQFEVFNAQGQLVASYEFSHTSEIELSLPGGKGVYFLKIRTAGRLCIKRIIKS